MGAKKQRWGGKIIGGVRLEWAWLSCGENFEVENAEEV